MYVFTRLVSHYFTGILLFTSEISSVNEGVISNNMNRIEETVYGLLRMSEKDSRRRFQDLERTMSDVIQLTADVYSNSLYEKCVISYDGTDEDTDKLFDGIVKLFHKEIIVYSNGFIKRLVTGFETDVTVYSDSLMRELICVFNEELVQYTDELLQMFDKEMEEYMDELESKILSIFDKEIEVYNHNFAKEIWSAFDEETKPLLQDNSATHNYLVDSDEQVSVGSHDLQLEATEPSTRSAVDVDMLQSETCIITEKKSIKAKSWFKKIQRGFKKLLVCGTR